MPTRSEPPRHRVPLADGALVAISALFTLGGAWLTWRGGLDRRTGIGLLAFFGLCLGVSLWTGWQRARARRSATARDVEIGGGVWHRVRIGKFVAMAVGVGAVLVVVSWASRGSSVAWLALSGALACFALVPGVSGRAALARETTRFHCLESRAARHGGRRRRGALPRLRARERRRSVLGGQWPRSAREPSGGAPLPGNHATSTPWVPASSPA